MKKLLLILFSASLLTGCMVTYQKHTGIPECDMAIMLSKIKSKKGYSAMEIGRYIDKCFEKLAELKREK